MTNSDKNFSFGFENVSSSQKTEKVTHVFKRVSSRYDLMNDVMSLGIHRLWKKTFIESLPLHEGGVYLDVAGGTGDIGSAVHRRLESNGFQSQVILCDINSDMIEVGRSRFPELTWVCGSAEALPLMDNSVDVYTIAFGLRNVTYWELSLKEAYRVLKPGGKFACLEFSQPIAPLRKIYDLYSFQILPRMGKWIGGDKAAYQYLAESIRTFLTREELLALMKEVGFSYGTYESLTGGIVSIHTGYKGL